MSLKTTAKGYNALSVNGVHFSNHSSLIEAVAEKASAILEADPALVVRVQPPVIEIRASDDAVPVPSPMPVVSDSGEDLVDFLERISAPPNIVATLPPTSTVEESLDEFAAETLKTWRPLRFYARHPDGREEWVGWGWRGYIVTWNHRDRQALRIGGAP